MHFEQLSAYEHKSKLTQATSLGKHLWSQYLQAGKGYDQIHIHFPSSSEACVSLGEAGRVFVFLIT